MCEGATKPLDKLYERMKDYMVDSESQVSKPSKVASSEGTGKVGSVSTTLQILCSYFPVDGNRTN